MHLVPVAILTYKVIEPEFFRERELEEALNELGAKGYEVAAFVPRSIDSNAKLILARRVAVRCPGENN